MSSQPPIPQNDISYTNEPPIFKKTSDEQVILKTVILQNQSVSYLKSPNRKTSQNDMEILLLFFLRIFFKN